MATIKRLGTGDAHRPGNMKRGNDHFTRNCIIGFAVICLIGVAVYMTFGRRHRSVMNTASPMSVVSSRNLVESTVQFYFSDTKSGRLAAEQRTFTHPEAPLEFARMIVSGLLNGPEQGGSAVLPAETTLKALYIMKDGTAVTDFSKEISEKHPGGALTEYLTVMAVVHSLTANIPDIKRVKILIDGKEADTLAGHIDLSRTFSPDMALVR